MKCKACRLHVYDYWDGQLSADSLASVQSHMKECPACARFFAAQRELARSLRGAANEAFRDLRWSGIGTATPAPMSVAPASGAKNWQRWLVPATFAAGITVAGLLWLFHPLPGVGRNELQQRLLAETRQQLALYSGWQPTGQNVVVVVIAVNENGDACAKTRPEPNLSIDKTRSDI